VARHLQNRLLMTEDNSTAIPGTRAPGVVRATSPRVRQGKDVNILLAVVGIAAVAVAGVSVGEHRSARTQRSSEKTNGTPPPAAPLAVLAVSPNGSSPAPDPGTVATRPPDSKALRDDEIGRLQASGELAGSWTDDARTAFGTWRQTSSAATAGAFSDVKCYVAGCTLTMTFADRGSFLNAANDFQNSAPFRAWSGGKFRSAPLTTSSGSIEGTWILYAREAEGTTTN
jgi:hypothetical protein